MSIEKIISSLMGKYGLSNLPMKETADYLNARLNGHNPHSAIRHVQLPDSYIPTLEDLLKKIITEGPDPTPDDPPPPKKKDGKGW